MTWTCISPFRLHDKRVSPTPLSEITGSFLQHKTLVVESAPHTIKISGRSALSWEL